MIDGLQRSFTAARNAGIAAFAEPPAPTSTLTYRHLCIGNDGESHVRDGSTLELGLRGAEGGDRSLYTTALAEDYV